jgi:acetyltransferase-like isoleucine patch superfamily enzyme
MSIRICFRPMAIVVAGTAIVDPRVEIGDGSTVGEFAFLGVEPSEPTATTLRIGAGSTIRSHSVIYLGNQIGDRFQTGHGVLVREDNVIGADVSIGTHSIVEHHVELGDGVRIHSNAFIPEYCVIEAGGWIGPSVTFTNARYPRSRRVKETLRGPIVRAGAMVGANATLLPGIVIGRRALIGAGSVVVADVPDGAVVAGNPARIIRRISDIEEYSST